MEGFRKLQLLLVEWDDASTHHDWHSEESEFLPLKCMAIGWRLPRSDRYNLKLATMRNSVGNCTEVHVIPRRSITRVVELKGED